jgi:hypothetical protein
MGRDLGIYELRVMIIIITINVTAIGALLVMSTEKKSTDA